jgi:hypothetical protein
MPEAYVVIMSFLGVVSNLEMYPCEWETLGNRVLFYLFFMGIITLQSLQV